MKKLILLLIFLLIASTSFSATIKIRRGLSTEWTAADPTLAAGELGIETNTRKIKIGTGSAAWTALSYMEASATLSDNSVTNAKMADDAIGVAELSATGTASSTTYLRGDNSWATVSTATQYSGTATLGTSAIASEACATVVTVSASGVATTDAIIWSFNADPTSTTGYTPDTDGILTIYAYPTANNVNFKVCNLTGGSITPGAVTLNWRVVK